MPLQRYLIYQGLRSGPVAPYQVSINIAVSRHWTVPFPVLFKTRLVVYPRHFGYHWGVSLVPGVIHEEWFSDGQGHRNWKLFGQRLHSWFWGTAADMAGGCFMTALLPLVPSLLFHDNFQWQSMDSCSCMAALQWNGRRVESLLFFEEHGPQRSLQTEDWWYPTRHGPRPGPLWVSYDHWEAMAGRQVPRTLQFRSEGQMLMQWRITQILET